ncbi:hypothetical protein KY285_026539 [Solanum tuberosum]|nr:hypothetical protein KY285_026539 [Solanum tuberosum]
MKRDQEKEDILEAQRRSKVDEELRLDELRVRASGASSNLVPTETVTTIPRAFEGAPELSLSVPATTGNTTDVSGDTRAHAS